MALDREAIASALFARLKAQVSAAKTFTRKDDDPRSFPSELHPVLILRCAGEDPEQAPGRPAKVPLHYVVKVYARNLDSEASPDTQLNQVLQQVDAALERQSDEAPWPNEPFHTTLGGLVQHAWLGAPVDFYQGEHSNEAMLVLAVEALACDVRR
jgi:hypothetical protein